MNMVGRTLETGVTWIVCQKCGKVFRGSWLAEYCRNCYIKHKLGLSPQLYDYVTGEEFKNASLEEKISMLSDWEEEHPEDREACEKIKKFLAGKINEIIKLEKKILQIQTEATIELERRLGDIVRG